MNIYYSRSNEVKDSEMGSLLEVLCNNIYNCDGIHEVKFTQHEQNSTYNPELLANADIVIVGVRDMDYDEPDIAKGCYSEIMNAFMLNKPVFVLLDCGDNDDPYLQQIRAVDVNLQDVECWQIGHAYINVDVKDQGGRRHANVNSLSELGVMLRQTLRTPDSDNPRQNPVTGQIYEGYTPEGDKIDSNDDLLLLG